MATTPDPLVGRTIDGRYEIKSRIARGGMATVYIANDKRLGRDVAVKVMHQHLAQGVDGAAFVSRFRREGRAAARLTHPGTVAVFDQGLDGDISYIVEEYVPGTNLRKELKAFGTLPLGKSLAVLEQVLSAVAAAHRKGLIHRDIKPENILIDDNGLIKITDFGLARAITEVTSTTTGTILGTMAYLAPEVIAAGICDPRTDVYAIGIMGYEILTGRLPHDASTPIQMAFQQVHQDVPPASQLVPWLPEELNELIERFTARDPRNRPIDGDHALTEWRKVRELIQDNHPHLLGRRAAPPEDYEEPDTGEIPELGAGIDLDSEELAAELDEIAALPAHAPVPATDRDELDPVTAQPLENVHLDEIPTSAFTPPEGIPIVSPTYLDPVTGPIDTVREPFWLPDGATKLPVVTTPFTEVVAAPEPDETNPNAAQPTTATGKKSTAPKNAGPPKNALRSKNPHRRQTATIIAICSLLLTGGVATGIWWWFNDGPGAFVTLPITLVGMDQAPATTYLADRHLATETVQHYSDEVPYGHVLAIAPPPGTQVRRGETVQLTVSSGVRLVTVPDGVLGAHQPEAETLLRAAGVRFAPATRAYSDIVPLGRVIAMSELEGAEIPHSELVTLTVSAGPSPITLPQHVGLPQDDAVQALHALGLIVTFAPAQPSDTIAEGSVMAQFPLNGSIVHRGDTVTLTISAGPPATEE